MQLGGALAPSGDRMKARTAYVGLPKALEGGDPDFPTLEEARVEYTALQ